MRSGSGSKAKGGSFERHVCRRLSLWLSDGQRDDMLWRSAMSGGRATVQFNGGKVNLNQAGDVSAVGHGAFAFCEATYVECKHYRDLQIDRSLVCGTGNLIGFWRTTVREAARYGKRPLLVAKQNLFPALAVCRDPVFGDSAVPIITSALLGAGVYSFDGVTAVTPPRLRRST